MIQIEQCGVTARQWPWRGIERGITDGHLEKESRVKERLDDRSRHLGPAIVVGSRELVARSLANDLKEPWMQRTVREKATEPPNDGVGLLLKPEYFDALMIEAVNRVFETPMVGRCVQKRFERLVLRV